MGLDHIIIRCIRKYEVYDILTAFHDDLCSDHFSTTRTAKKVLSMGY